MPTTPADLLDAASERTGLSDFGDDWFRAPLELFVQDLDEGVLNELGQSFMREQAIRDLVRRQRVLDYLRQHPEIDDVEIPPIVYVAGQIRSGTTLLHNVLAQHELARPLLRWELMEPVPAPEASTYRTDSRIARIQASIDKRRGTLLERMHWVNADEPEECQWAFIDLVSILAGAASGCMHRWGEFIATTDFTPVYENYRRIVKLLLWKNPPVENGFLVLKAPQTTVSIAAFAQVFPEAQFVAPARDPFRVTVSGRAMVADIIEPLVDHDLLSDEHQTATMMTSIERSVAAMTEFEHSAARPPQIVPYTTLVANPVDTAVGLYEHLGVANDPTLAAKAAAFIEAQRSGARSTPPSELSEVDLDQDEVLARPVFADFCARHGIEPERERLTGAHS